MFTLIIFLMFTKCSLGVTFMTLGGSFCLVPGDTEAGTVKPGKNCYCSAAIRNIN